MYITFNNWSEISFTIFPKILKNYFKISPVLSQNPSEFFQRTL